MKNLNRLKKLVKKRLLKNCRKNCNSSKLKWMLHKRKKITKNVPKFKTLWNSYKTKLTLYSNKKIQDKHKTKKNLKQQKFNNKKLHNNRKKKLLMKFRFQTTLLKKIRKKKKRRCKFQVMVNNNKKKNLSKKLNKNKLKRAI